MKCEIEATSMVVFHVDMMMGNDLDEVFHDLTWRQWNVGECKRYVPIAPSFKLVNYSQWLSKGY